MAEDRSRFQFWATVFGVIPGVAVRVSPPIVVFDLTMVPLDQRESRLAGADQEILTHTLDTIAKQSSDIDARILRIEERMAQNVANAIRTSQDTENKVFAAFMALQEQIERNQKRQADE